MGRRLVTIYVSPAEPAKVKRMLMDVCGDRVETETHGAPERKGVDFLWRGNAQWWGVQRKEIHDYLASLNDNRLTREMGQMRASVTMPMVILEGKVQATTTGMLMDMQYGKPIHIETLWGRLFSMQLTGVHVMTSSNIRQTCEMIRAMYEWSQKADHMTGRSMAKPLNDWGTRTNKDYALAIHQMIPTIGPKMAEVLYDHFGGCILDLTVTRDELMQVFGLGAKSVDRIMRVFEERKRPGKGVKSGAS
jgi:ERCC4-type nuclease